MAAPETKHFEILDGLRGVAAIAVLVGHASILFLQSTWVPRKLLAVQFFFMLSGFVITHAYEGKLRAGMTWREFMLRRIIRLYPLIVLAALVGFASYVVRNGFRHPGAMSARLLCAAFDVPCLVIRGGEDQYFAINPPEWSLFFEMTVYAIYAAALSRFSALALGLLVVGLAPASTYAVIAFGDHIPFVWHAADSLMSYSIGVLLYRWRQARPRKGGSSNVLILGVPIILLTVLPRSIGWWPDLVSMFAIFPAIILLGSASAPLQRENVITQVLGQISYPVYILHWPIFIFALVAFRSATSGARMALSIIAALCFAWTILKTYDRPLRSWLSKR